MTASPEPVPVGGSHWTKTHSFARSRGLRDDEVSIRVHYWITDPTRRDVFAVRSAYALAVKERLEAEGITISPAEEREISGRIQLDETPDE